MSTTDTERATSFGAVAEDYDRLRPTPPAGIVEWLLPAGPRLVVDLAAGTGAMTRQLVGRVRDVVAIEPDGRMLAVLTRRSRGVHAVRGRAEALPLRDGCADAVIVSSAWHWMDPDVSAPQVARVLRDGGRFGVVWTGRDHHDPLMRELMAAAMRRRSVDDRRWRVARFSALDLPPGSPFGATEGSAVQFTVPMTPAELAESLGTYSFAPDAPGGIAGTVRRAREFLAERFEPGTRLDVPMGARAFRCDRLPRR